MSRSAEGEALCRGLGLRIWGMHKRVPLISRRSRRRREHKRSNCKLERNRLVHYLGDIHKGHRT